VKGRSVPSDAIAWTMLSCSGSGISAVCLAYASYDNETRTHLSLDKDAPLTRTVKRAGRIVCRPVLGGLHPRYGRI
jgi:hypothetical protein